MRMDEQDLILAGDPAEDPQDDLKAINGIGPKFAEALHALGVRRYADLVDYQPGTLSKDLVARAGVRVPSERIEANHWIDQARELIRNTNAEHNSPQQEAEPEEARETGDDPVPSRQHAGFSLFFDYVEDDQTGRVWQTRIYHEESGEERLFPGTGTAPWLTWILERAHLPERVLEFRTKPDLGISPLPEAAAGTGPLVRAQPEEACLEIPGIEMEMAQPRAGTGKETLWVRVPFHVSGPQGDRLAERRSPYRLEIHMVDLERGVSRLVSSELGKLEPEVFQYESHLEFEIPAPGRYELHCMLLLTPPGALMGSRRGPTFRVVP
jgi:hypothetical protein